MLAKDLRAHAEDAARLTRRDVATLTDPHEIQRLVHELQVHQIELEMQNESLRQAQHDLEASYEQYLELFDCAPAGYFLLDAVGMIVYANAAGLALLRLGRQRLNGQHLSAFVVPHDWPSLQEQLRAVQRTARASCEVRLRTTDGTALYARADVSVSGRAPGDRLVMLTDISERKRSQETLESSNRSLEARVASRTLELEARNRQLETEIASRIESDEQRRALETRLRESERLESLGLLAAGIAHDFNNLLVSVLGNADLLLLTPELSDSSRESLKLIKQAGHNASALTHHLLMFAGEGAVRLAAVDLPSAAVSALALLQPNLPSHIRLETQLARACPAIHADASQINQIVMNLVTNAAEAIDGQGQISVSTHAAELDAAALAEFQHHRCAQPGQFVILQVQDSGSGMDAATVSRIFDPFFSTKFTGRGLGLASVLGIAQGHCGALRVRTREGAGTSFEIAFPVSSHEPVRLAKPSVPVLDWSGSGPLLLIDDDDAVRRVLTLLLRALGFDVTAVASGKAGLELFMRKDPAFPVVVLDWLMPGLSGEQVLRALRELEPTLPVLLVSGYSAQDFESNDAYVARLQKPMTLGQLRAALRRLTGSALAARSSAARER